jgi:KDO2-lipid IV(A) lauroyltransferase
MHSAGCAQRILHKLILTSLPSGLKNQIDNPAQSTAFFSGKNSKEIIKIAKGVYRHFAIVAAEFFDMPYITEVAIAKGKGILSVVAHFGNWELLPIAIPMYAKPIYIVYRPLDNPNFDNMVEYVRTM